MRRAEIIGWRRSAWLAGMLGAIMPGAVLLGLAGCAGDPADYGLTGPHPEGVPPVTLTRPVPRVEATDDTPGLHVEAADRYANLSRMGSANTAPPLRRYYGYDH